MNRTPGSSGGTVRGSASIRRTTGRPARTSPLYDRFRAELTWRALEAERRGGEPREGVLWQDLSWAVGAPALSPDGQKLVVEVDRRDRPSRLVVWSTAPDEKKEKEWEEERRKLLERDPEDVPAVRSGPFPREPLHELPSPDGIEPTTPRWMAASTWRWSGRRARASRRACVC